MFNEMALWPTVKFVLAWVGLIAGGLVGMGCMGGALLGVVAGDTNPFGKNKADFWVSFLIALVAGGLFCYCTWFLFMAKGEATTDAPKAGPPVSTSRPRRGRVSCARTSCEVVPASS